MTVKSFTVRVLNFGMQGDSHISLSLKYFPCNSRIIGLHKSGRDTGMLSSSFFAQSSVNFRVNSGCSGHYLVEFSVLPIAKIP